MAHRHSAMSVFSPEGLGVRRRVGVALFAIFFFISMQGPTLATL